MGIMLTDGELDTAMLEMDEDNSGPHQHPAPANRRAQVSPQDLDVVQLEPLLCVVTDPMKSVTKLGRASAAAAPPMPPPPPMDPAAGYEHLKRKCARR